MSDKYYFNRVYSLTIGTPAVGSTGFDEAVYQSGKAKTITGLRVTFDIKKTETPESNSCTITVNNLSDSTRKFIKARNGFSGTGMIVTLRAGYEEMHGNNLPIIFTGDITNVWHDITAPNVVTTMECHEGRVSIKHSGFSKSYRSGARVRQIITDIITELGLPIHAAVDLSALPDYTLSRGFAFDGLASDALTRICSGYGLRWSVQNNSVKVYPTANRNGTPGTDNRAAITGMLVGSPKRVKKDMKAIDAVDFIGYEFNALLMPEVCPGGKVHINSIESGNVILGVSDVHHRGDNWGTGAGSWNSTIRARDL